jgi:hypothetical protein
VYAAEQAEKNTKNGGWRCSGCRIWGSEKRLKAVDSISSH